MNLSKPNALDLWILEEHEKTELYARNQRRALSELQIAYRDLWPKIEALSANKSFGFMPDVFDSTKAPKLCLMWQLTTEEDFRAEVHRYALILDEVPRFDRDQDSLKADFVTTNLRLWVLRFDTLAHPESSA